MPELPDLVYIEKRLRPQVLNREIRQVAVWEPIVLRMGIPGSFSEVLRGKTIRDLRLNGPFLVLKLPPLEMIVHFMLAGFFRLEEKRCGVKQTGLKPTNANGAKKTGGNDADSGDRSLKRKSREHCFSLELGGGRHLLYFDSRRMGKIYVIEAGATIRRTGVLGNDSFFCPKCQPELRSRLVPWDRLP